MDVQASSPLEHFDRLREHEPMAWDARTRSWYVTRYEDVSALLVDSRLGARRVEYCPADLSEAQRDTYWMLMGFVDRWPVFSDPPRHTALRHLLRRLFVPAVTQRVTATVAAVVRERCRDVQSDRLFADVVRPALQFGLADLLEEDTADLAQLATWASRILSIGSIETYRAEDGEEARKTLAEFGHFVEGRCAVGDGVLATALREGMASGELDLSDATATYAQLVTGALEPSAAAAAVLLQELTRERADRERISANLDDAVTEALRLATPFHLAPRRALSDIPLRGQVMAEGDRVVLVLAAANRDPRRFSDPLDFRLGRQDGLHLAFGRGRHACLGAGLTRGTMEAVVRELIAAEAVGKLPPLQPDWDEGFGARFARGMSRSD
ncbi:cytochrome P450 [Streptomyces sp. NPDC053253]|uniref:cytochrome P450 n=1 Tax=Streptomyces sp. NPDC053253 TaxID=3365699 RepID=UPI0037D4A051